MPSIAINLIAPEDEVQISKDPAKRKKSWRKRTKAMI